MALDQAGIGEAAARTATCGNGAGAGGGGGNGPAAGGAYLLDFRHSAASASAGRALRSSQARRFPGSFLRRYRRSETRRGAPRHRPARPSDRGAALKDSSDRSPGRPGNGEERQKASQRPRVFADNGIRSRGRIADHGSRREAQALCTTSGR